MFRKTLICLDGSKTGEAILTYLLEYCPKEKTELIMLNVVEYGITIPPPQSTHTMSYGTETRPDRTLTSDVGKTSTLEPSAALQLKGITGAQDQARKYLDDKARPFRSNGFKVKTIILEGEPGVTILNYAIDNKISLIALSTNGAGGVKRKRIGRVAKYLLNESPIPVLSIRPRG